VITDAAWILLGAGWCIAIASFVTARHIRARSRPRTLHRRDIRIPRRIIIVGAHCCIWSIAVPVLNGASWEVVLFWLAAVVPATYVVMLVVFAVTAVSWSLRKSNTSSYD
jgi:hypothetical protein